MCYTFCVQCEVALYFDDSKRILITFSTSNSLGYCGDHLMSRPNFVPSFSITQSQQQLLLANLHSCCTICSEYIRKFKRPNQETSELLIYRLAQMDLHTDTRTRTRSHR